MTADTQSDGLLERLADLEHEQWSTWTEHMLQVLAPALVALEMSGDISDDADAAVFRWRRQIVTPYADLTGEEKESDREWARKVLELLRPEPVSWRTSDPREGTSTRREIAVCVDRKIFGAHAEAEHGWSIWFDLNHLNRASIDAEEAWPKGWRWVPVPWTERR